MFTPQNRQCRQCGNAFIAHRNDEEFCSRICERVSVLTVTAQLIRDDNTAIMPDGVIVARGTPGSTNYESANKKP